MTASGRTPTLLLDSLAAEIGCDAVRPLPCLAGILPESVQLRYAQSGTCIHGRLQLAIYKQLLRNVQLPSGGRGRMVKYPRPERPP